MNTTKTNTTKIITETITNMITITRTKDLIDIKIVRKMSENNHPKIETRNKIPKTRITRNIGIMLKSKPPTMI